jgi:hypothetical protein
MSRDLWVTLADCIEHVLPVLGFYLAEEEITFLPSPLATMKDIFVAIEVVRVLIIVGPKCSRETLLLERHTTLIQLLQSSMQVVLR